MAMAVVSFALVAIAGLMPVGLQSMRDSQNDQALGTIANQLRGDLQQIPFGTGAGTLGGLTSTNYYYTAEGVKTDPSSTAGQVYYAASFAVTNAAINGSAYGGSITAPNNAAVVTVTLTYPYPALTETNRFTLFAAKQVGL
jgi:uncharacterized protein (TIGR02598 family)